MKKLADRIKDRAKRNLENAEEGGDVEAAKDHNEAMKAANAAGVGGWPGQSAAGAQGTQAAAASTGDTKK